MDSIIYGYFKPKYRIFVLIDYLCEIASFKGNISIVKFLCDCRADINRTNNEGWTPLMAGKIIFDKLSPCFNLLNLYSGYK